MLYAAPGATGAKLTHQLLSLARSGRHEPVPVDLNAVVLKSGKLFEASHRAITGAVSFPGISAVPR